MAKTLVTTSTSFFNQQVNLRQINYFY